MESLHHPKEKERVSALLGELFSSPHDQSRAAQEQQFSSTFQKKSLIWTKILLNKGSGKE